MDRWLSDSIDDEIEVSERKPRHYNACRNVRRMVRSFISECTSSYGQQDVYMEEPNLIYDTELMDTSLDNIVNQGKSSSSKTLANELISKRISVDSLSDEEDDDELHTLAAYEPFLESDTTDSSELEEHIDLNDDRRLHSLTDICTYDACVQLMKLLRNSRVCKAQVKGFMSFFKNILPTPNNLPSTMNELLSKINVKACFEKRIVCSLCGREVDLKSKRCTHCSNFDKKHLIFIYDMHFNAILTSKIKRLFNIIQDYKEKIDCGFNRYNNEAYDIPFAQTYQNLLQKHCEGNFISLLFHVDGISLCKSTKLKMWIFSSSIIELPPSFRYCRQNMPLISVWVGSSEPNLKVWLDQSIRMLKLLKRNGMLFLHYSH